MSDLNQEIDQLKRELKQKLKEARKKKAVIRSSKYIKESQKTCDICNITTNKYNFEKHLLTKSHIKKSQL